MQTDDLEAKLLRYEKDFFDAKFCGNINNLESRLSECFYEIGSSGKKITREDVIQELSKLSENREIEITQFEVDILDANTVLVRYKANFKDRGKISWRLSIWKKQERDWVLFFHQGTECNERRTSNGNLGCI